MSHPSPSSTEKPHANEREEGAVLIVVMMMLLAISATAVYTVSNATSELRGASAMRTSYQTESMAVAMVESVFAYADAHPGREFADQLDVVSRSGGAVSLAGTEGLETVPNNTVYRLDQSNLSLDPALSVIDDDSVNRSSPSRFVGFADVYDKITIPSAAPGSRVDGAHGGAVEFWRIVVTGRAVTELRNTTGLTPEVSESHRTMATARAIAIVGPIPALPGGI